MTPRHLPLMFLSEDVGEPFSGVIVVIVAGPYCVCSVGSVGGVIYVGRIENEAVLGSVGGSVDTSTVCVCA